MLIIPIKLFHVVWRWILQRIDRWTDPPIMHEHVNEGSDKYFEWRHRHEGDSEVGELFEE